MQADAQAPDFLLLITENKEAERALSSYLGRDSREDVRLLPERIIYEM